MIWNDNAPVLFQANCHDGSGTIKTKRKRPSISSTNAKQARSFFGNQATKEIDEPEALWLYNYHMNPIDVGDQLKSYMAGLRPIRIGGWKAIWHWLFNTILMNAYKLSFHSDVEPHLKWTKQTDFRRAIIDAIFDDALLPAGDYGKGTRKRRFSGMSGNDILIPQHRHTRCRMSWQGECKCCKGERLGDRILKRPALGQISHNLRRRTQRRRTIMGCQECNIHLCKEGPCFDRYHGRE